MELPEHCPHRGIGEGGRPFMCDHLWFQLSEPCSLDICPYAGAPSIRFGCHNEPCEETGEDLGDENRCCVSCPRIDNLCPFVCRDALAWTHRPTEEELEEGEEFVTCEDMEVVEVPAR